MGRHAKAKGINPGEITQEERATLMEDMIEEHYPGIVYEYNEILLPKIKYAPSLISPGLDSLPNTLMETMLPNISPESAAEAAVQIFGGYDGRFGVSNFS